MKSLAIKNTIFSIEVIFEIKSKVILTSISMTSYAFKFLANAVHILMNVCIFGVETKSTSMNIKCKEIEKRMKNSITGG